MSMNGKVCPKCQIELRPLKNGVLVMEMAIQGPQAFWQADLWHCPECGLEVILGFSKNPQANCYDEDWLEVSAKLLAGVDKIYPVFLNRYERDAHVADKCSAITP